MALGDLNTESGIKDLNIFLEDKSYICGYFPTQMDVTAFKTISKPPVETYAHALRWYNHIKSFSADECEKFILGECPVKAGRECMMKVGDACPMKTAPTTTQPAKDDDDDDVDLFASDEEESEEAARIRDERVKAYADKKSQKPGLIAKSSILLDVKPWDDETDMKIMEENVRKIEMDGLVWGVSKLVPVGYGIHKLQIVCVVVDDKVSVDLLTEEIEKIEDYVQSVDIAAFNKI